MFAVVVLQSIFQAPCADLPSTGGIIDNVSPAAFVDNCGKKPLIEDPFEMLVNVSTAEYHLKYKDFKIVNEGVSGEASSSNII
jgi:hypothetical protein